MAKKIQISGVPDRLYNELMRRAKARKLSLAEYTREVLEREVARPPAEEVFARIRSRSAVALERPAADLIREAREESC